MSPGSRSIIRGSWRSGSEREVGRRQTRSLGGGILHGLIGPEPSTALVARLVLLDANALLMPFQFRINLEAEIRRLLGDIEIAVPGPVLQELRTLSGGGRKAASALRLAETFPSIEGHGAADDALLDLATGRGAIVVTNDAALRSRLRQNRVPVVFLRSRSHLVLEWA